MDVNTAILIAIGGWFLLIGGGVVTALVVLFRLRRRYQKLWFIMRDDMSGTRIRTKQEVQRLDYDGGSYFWSQETSISLKWWGIPFGRQCDFIYGLPYAIDYYSQGTYKDIKLRKEKWEQEMKDLTQKHFNDLQAKDAKLAESVKKAGFLDVQFKFWNAKDVFDYLDAKVIQKFIYSEDVLEFIKLLVIIVGGLVAIGIILQFLTKPAAVTCLDINQTAQACKQALQSRLPAIGGGF